MNFQTLRVSVRRTSICVMLLWCLPSFFLAAQDRPLVQARQLQTLNQEAMASTGRFSRYGSYFGVISRDNRVQMYDSSFQVLWTYRGQGEHGTAAGIAISGDEAWTIFTGYGNPSAIAVVRSADGELINRLTGHSREVQAIALSSDDRFLVSYAPGEVLLWGKTSDGFELLQSFDLGDFSVSYIDISPDSRLLALGGNLDRVRMFRIEDDGLREIEGIDLKDDPAARNYVNGGRFSPDGQWFVTGLREDIRLYRVDGQRFELSQTISELPSSYVYSTQFSPDSRILFTGFEDSSVGVYRLGSGHSPLWEYESSFSSNQGYMADLAIRSDGSRFATLSISDNGVIIWSLEGVPGGALGKLSSMLRQMIVESQSGDASSPALGSAQMSVLNEHLAQEILAELGDAALAPRDMFESSEAYQHRLHEASERAFAALEQAIVERYSARRLGDNIAFSPQGQGSYDIDRELYSLPIAADEGRISISPDQARSLYINWDGAEVLASGGVSGDWTLVHPVSGAEYPVLFDRDPLSGYRQSSPGFLLSNLEISDRFVLSQVEVEALFPALVRSYVRQPLLSGQLDNRLEQPIENLRVSSRWGDSGEALEILSGVSIAAGQSIPLSAGAYVDQSVLYAEGADIFPLILEFSYRVGGRPFQREQRIPVQRLNANALRWDDDRKVAAMVTTIQSEVIMESAGGIMATLDSAGYSGLPKNLAFAQALYESLRDSGMTYRVDPASSYQLLSDDDSAIDYVQFPMQTLRYSSGDCDDLSVLFASLLEAAGVSSAFVTVPGHIFVAVDSGLNPEQAEAVFPDGMQTIVHGQRVWIPLELTVLDENFYQAWTRGAQSWLRYSNRSEAQFIVTSEAWQVYPPADVSDGENSVVLAPLAINQMSSAMDDTRQVLIQRFVEKLSLQEPSSRRDFNRRGILYARFAYYAQARDDFLSSLDGGEYAPSLINLSKLAALDGDDQVSEEYLIRAQTVQPENPHILIQLAIQRLENGEESSAKELYDRVSELDAALAQRYPLFDAEGGDGVLTSDGSRAAQENDLVRDYLLNEWVY